MEITAGKLCSLQLKNLLTDIFLQGYMPTKKDRREGMIQRKRQEYIDLLRQYYFIPDTDRGLKEQNTLRQILVDIPRTNADVPLFKNERIHQVGGPLIRLIISCFYHIVSYVEYGAHFVHLGYSPSRKWICSRDQ